jgi:hypothetical protein
LEGQCRKSDNKKRPVQTIFRVRFPALAYSYREVWPPVGFILVNQYGR